MTNNIGDHGNCYVLLQLRFAYYVIYVIITMLCDSNPGEICQTSDFRIVS